MKVRIGVSLTGSDPAEFSERVDELEELGIDSLWLSELVYSPLVEPFVGMSWALSRTSKLKVGTGVAVLPGRSPILVAKQLASLGRLAPKRVLPVFGLSPARKQERVAFPLPESRKGAGSEGKRGAVFDESLHLVRRLLREPEVDFDGEFFQVQGATVGDLPDTPLDIWLGGSAEAGLKRIGRYGDGWLASFITPDEAAAGIDVITRTAAEAGRTVDPEHYGISIPVAFGELPELLVTAIRQRRSDASVDDIVPQGWEAARRLIERYVEAGMSKFVVRPAGPAVGAGSGDDFLPDFVRELAPLQT